MPFLNKAKGIELIFYKIGCNFDLKLLYGICQLNKLNSNVQISELYGSDRQHAYLTARPYFRLPDINEKYFEKYVSKCVEAGIQFNYTLNTIYPGSKKLLVINKKEIVNFVRYLESIGVKIITISNPILADLVREASTTIRLEVSTIAHIDAITQIKVWKDKYNIVSVCNNLLKNRSIKFLKNAALYCNKHGIALSLMVNEFCGNGGGNGYNSYGTHCIYRDSCYMCHADNINKQDDKLLNNYPMRHCISSRSSPFFWLKARFIRPEDIEKYANIGIKHFKITGRTGGTDYILKVAEAYVRKSWEGNLLSLWKHLETIYTEENEIKFKTPYFIDNKALSGFIDYWFENIDHECENEICGETCNYCNNFYKDFLCSIS